VRPNAVSPADAAVEPLPATSSPTDPEETTVTPASETTPHKALVAGLAAATAVIGSLIVAVTAGSDGGTAITVTEALQAAWVGLSAGGGAVGVYVVRNDPK
jgi:hypothetical protein